MPDKEHLRKLLGTKKRRLQKLLEQQAYEGVKTDPAILLEIEDLEDEITKIEGSLALITETSQVSESSIGQTPSYFFKHSAVLMLIIVLIVILFIVGLSYPRLVNLFSSPSTPTSSSLVSSTTPTDRQSQIANIEITTVCAYFWGCDGVIQVMNLGPADAHNLRIILHGLTVNDLWEQSVQDIDDFSIRIPSPLIDYTINTRTVDTLSTTDMTSGDNAFEITIENLQRDESFLIIIKPASSIPTDKYDIVRHVTIHKVENLFYLDALRKDFNRKFAVTTFGVEFKCDNCDIVTTPGSFIVSSVEYWHWEFIGGQDGISDALKMNATYLVPQGTVHTPEISDLELEVTSQYGGVVLQEKQ